MRVLAITKIFPNAAEPLSSPFNRQQFAALGRRCEVEVLATIPWFPGQSLLARKRGANGTAIPDREVIDGLSVRHPRTLYLPRVGHSLAGLLYAASVLPDALAYRGTIDVVLGSWAYPDGCAAVALARLLGVPAVVKLHGSDVNVVARMPGPRRVMTTMLPRAARVIAVSRPLADEVAALGVPRERIAVVYNGVDAALFHSRDRAAARRTLGLPPERPVLLYVGHLKETKGVLDLVAGFAELAAGDPAPILVMVGDGPDAERCRSATAGLGDRVRLVGARPLPEIPEWMAACDALVLPSWAEGTPNCVLEALSCGRRVVATAVGGTPDLLDDERLGELVPARDPAALAAAMARAAHATYDPAEIAAAGARGSWDDSAAAIHQVLRDAVAA
jgi:teichuronic acid biosynthesis glycosyltransferase TuaC